MFSCGYLNNKFDTYPEIKMQAIQTKFLGFTNSRGVSSIN